MSSSTAPNPTQPPTYSDATMKRNPHGDFKTVEASREDFDTSKTFHHTKTPKPDWKLGDGGNDGGESLNLPHREIDPYEEGRPVLSNYKLLISGIVPRPIGFVSTKSLDGTSTNLAPFSFFNVYLPDPPTFVLGFSPPSSSNPHKDTIANLISTFECTINIISEHYIEAANACAVNSPYGVSEWSLSGLHPAKSSVVKADRVKEAVFSIEAKLVDVKEFKGKRSEVVSGQVAILEGVRFWVREDATNEEGSWIDPKILKPVSRLGGITFGRSTEGFELPRANYDDFVKDEKFSSLLEGEKRTPEAS